ncbi:MupG family TIM beta-alpha barrel fold protein [Spiroplasma endosymbiont of Panorpa germanica]|uniref:MupG family TIM beta-alpha barrel fold protein n=1 Tax=Spiroplasma endosymbiont of Panorpa germanica TaxID=3066314 RepID=UPI0030D3D2D5
MFDRKLGIAIYPEKMVISEMKDYIDKAVANGFSILWSALLQLDLSDSKSKDILKKYKEIFSYGKSKNMSITIDVNSRILNEIKFNNDLKFFIDLGVDVIRFDSPIEAINLAKLTFNDHNIAVELNMDNNDYFVNDVLSYQPIHYRVQGSHNFYPQKNCGLTDDYFIQTSKKFRALGLRTTAFISSLNENKVSNWAIDDNCCTLESLRDKDVTTQAIALWASGLNDDIIISNAYATEQELIDLGNLDRFIPEIKIALQKNATKIEEEILNKEIHFRRGDVNPKFIRSTQSRVKFKNDDFPVKELNDDFKKGDIIIGNNNFSLYKGELQLIIDDVEKDNRKNLVAKVKTDQLFLLDYIKPWTRFKFKITK